jgi:amphi-Trp domain-containing protein
MATCGESHDQSADNLPMMDRDLSRTYSRTQFVAKLRRLADAIESKRPFTIQVAGERFRVPADALFNVEHERSGANEEIEFQLLWTHDGT